MKERQPKLERQPPPNSSSPLTATRAMRGRIDLIAIS